MNQQPRKPKPPFAQQAAQFSWAAPLIALAASMVGNNLIDIDGKYEYGEQIAMADRIASGAVALFVLLLIVSGLCMGVIALTRVKTHGKAKILVPAIIGIVLNSLLLTCFGIGLILPLL